MHGIALTRCRLLAAVAAWRQQYQISALTSLKAAFLRLPLQFVQRRSQSKMSTETLSKAIHLKPTKNSFQIFPCHYAPQTSVKAYAEEVVLGDRSDKFCCVEICCRMFLRNIALGLFRAGLAARRPDGGNRRFRDQVIWPRKVLAQSLYLNPDFQTFTQCTYCVRNTVL